MSRILMVLDREFPPDIRVENEIHALIRAGHIVHIACYTMSARRAYEVKDKLTIHRKPITSFRYKSSVASLTFPFYFGFWRSFLKELISFNDFDVIHVHDLPLVKTTLYFKSAKIRVVVDLHENWPAYLKISKHTNTLLGKLLSPLFLWRTYERKVLKKADEIVVVVEEAKSRLIKLGLPGSKITVVSNTINLDLPEFTPPKKHNEIILYYAGGINYHRGLQNVIAAIHKAKNPLIRFWILGEGSYKPELMTLVNKLSLGQQVIFYGFQPFSKVMEMLSESDYAMIPHLKTEHTDSTIPHKLFQYMYLAKPVIASDCLPIKRILEETGAGISYPSSDTEYLGKLLNHLDSLNYINLAEKGREAVIHKYNWKVDSDRLIKMYHKLS
jgi:glycosyltransferase involved in cell wall biosynthesis